MDKLALVMLLGFLCELGTSQKKPNIIFFMADDMGWNDIGWHNPNIPTPKLDKMASEGVLLDDSYAIPQCTPSRSSLMSGLYPSHVGLQHFVIFDAQASAVPLNLTLLPEYLKKGGYDTHMIGKWHLGMCNWAMVPTRRGFDTFYGLYLGEGDFYYHTDGDSNSHEWLDFRDQEKPNWFDSEGYATNLFADRAVKILEETDPSKPFFMYFAPTDVHSPMQVPDTYKDKCSTNLPDNRRLFCGKTAVLDEAMANITAALDRKGLTDNTLIIFLSDNGGDPYGNDGNNWPFRGLKGGLWEGSARALNFVWGPGILKGTPFTSHELVHIVDWLPTILSLAGLDPAKEIPYKIDGLDVSPVITKNGKSPRTEFVYNLDQIWNGTALRQGKYKIIVGNNGTLYDWYPEPINTCDSQCAADGRCTEGESIADYDSTHFSYAYRMADSATFGPSFECLRNDYESCYANKSGNIYILAYDLEKDPEERHDISKDPAMKDNILSMLKSLSGYVKSAVPPQNVDASVPEIIQDTDAANPRRFEGVWSPGWC